MVSRAGVGFITATSLRLAGGCTGPVPCRVLEYRCVGKMAALHASMSNT
jgi:hypothetical protein